MAKPFRWIFGTDLHGDQASSSTFDAFLDFTKHFNPEVRIASEFFDFRPFRRSATAQEQRESIAEDLASGIDGIRRFKPTVYLRGNHCERLWDKAAGDEGPTRDLARVSIASIEKVLGRAPMLPYCKRKGIYQLNPRWRVIHGYHAAQTAAKMAAQVYGNVLMGHVHTRDTVILPGIDRVAGHSVAALCRLDMDYNRATPSTLRHSNGWAYGMAWPTGECIVWHAEQVAGRWILPSEIREIAA